MTTQNRGASPLIVSRTFDPKIASAKDWTAYHAYRRLRAAEEVPDDPIIPDHVRQRDMIKDWPLTENHYRIATIDGGIAGTLVAWTRRPGSDDYGAHARYIGASIGVRRDQRRRGVGTAMLRELQTMMHARGNEIVTTVTHITDGIAYLEAIGAALKQREVENRLAIADVPTGLIAQWTTIGDVTPDLRWEVHAGRVPLERYEALVPQMTVLVNDQPREGLDHPPWRIDMPQIRAWYADMDVNGGAHIMVLLIAGETVAAISEAIWFPEFPDRADQQLTGVAAAYRGRGLAKAVKAKLIEIVQASLPSVGLITTTNAAVNGAMLAVNTRLGFKPHRDQRTYQMTRDQIDAVLDRAR